MNAPNGDVLDAIKRIAGRPEGMVILGYLQEQAEMCRTRATYEMEPVQLRLWQGRAQALDILLRAWKP